VYNLNIYEQILTKLTSKSIMSLVESETVRFDKIFLLSFFTVLNYLDGQIHWKWQNLTHFWHCAVGLFLTLDLWLF